MQLDSGGGNNSPSSNEVQTKKMTDEAQENSRKIQRSA